MENISDKDYLLKLANTRMPFGKHAGRYLIDLPESYLLWLKKTSMPKGELGKMLEEVYEIKENGLEQLIRKMRV